MSDVNRAKIQFNAEWYVNKKKWKYEFIFQDCWESILSWFNNLIYNLM